ncbi:hypothetical protein RF11_03762 [Thelohanellus kitauei]|uniref:Serpin domain-containing protein n=1 Tax=Thelohanellus kitauei TaxID=669202 RepID=A0A0C2NCB9_THEKT|nr:hypothetical protein RF11_03762 [Thelohanellus kitauei]
MADTINELTLKLANFLLHENERINSVSISGYITYLTLLLLNIGLQGQAKYDLSVLLNCNYSYIQYSLIKNVFEFDCIHSFKMDEFMKVGNVKSAIFHSNHHMETFQAIAMETYNFELIEVDPRNNDLQKFIINYWGQTLKHVPFHDILFEPYTTDLQLLIINEYFISFKWKLPANPRYTNILEFTDISFITTQVKMMRMVDHYRFYNDQELQALIAFIELEEKNTYAVVVLPYLNNNIQSVLKGMEVGVFNNLEPYNTILV